MGECVCVWEWVAYSRYGLLPVLSIVWSMRSLRGYSFRFTFFSNDAIQKRVATSDNRSVFVFVSSPEGWAIDGGEEDEIGRTFDPLEGLLSGLLSRIQCRG